MTVLAAALLALLLSLALTPVARRLALRFGITDSPDDRRIHTHPTPRAGGMAVAAATILTILLGGGIPDGPEIWVLAGAGLLLVVGAADDILSLRAELKLVAQIVAAVLAVTGGLRLHLIGPGAEGMLAWLDPTLTVVWIVLITNALNLSDGIDGLAAGIGIISLVVLGAAVLRAGHPETAFPALVLAGALAGFLVYNFNPASIFLGDAGSLVIGFAMATLPLAAIGEGSLPPVAAFLLVAVPATDTLLAIARRFLSRCLRAWGSGQFWEGIREGLGNTVNPDRRHIHHRLLDLGFTQRRAVLLLYGAAAATSGLAYFASGRHGWPVDVVVLLLTVAVIWVVQALGFDELQPARSGLFLPVLRRVARHRRLVMPVDFCLVAAMYGIALALTGGKYSSTTLGTAAVGLIAAIQLAAFAVFDVYRTAWGAAGIGGFGLLFRACAAGTIAGYVATRLLKLPAGGDAALIHFLLLLPAVTLMRFSQVLLTQTMPSGHARERALICGTGPEGRHALARLRRRGTRGRPPIEPVGFIEFRPRLQGRRLGMLRVLGTLEDLDTILREREVQNLVIADTAVRGEDLHWVNAVCRQRGVNVYRYVERLVPADPLIEQLRSAPDLAASWSIMGDLFRSVALDACVLALMDPPPGGMGEIPTWRRAPGSNASMPASLALYVTNGREQLAEIVPHLNGRPITLRRNAEGWRALPVRTLQSGDLIAAPVRAGGDLWGVLLATARTGKRVISAADLARLGSATDVLGRNAERWS